MHKVYSVNSMLHSYENEQLPQAAMWRKLTDAMLSESCQPQKTTYSLITVI